MANEITYAVSFSASKGGASISSGTISDTEDMTGTDMETGTQSVGTSNEALAYNSTDITGDVHLVIKNLDATNYVEIFKDSGNSHLLSKLKAGQACSLRNVPSSSSLFARANTAAVLIQYWICEA